MIIYESIYDYVWLCMIMYDYIGLHMITYIWLYMIMNDYIQYNYIHTA